MKKAWLWVKKHITSILGVIVAALVGWLAWGSMKRRTGKLKDEVALAKAERDLKALNVRRDTAVERMGEKAADARALKSELRDTKKKIVEIRERKPIVETLTDDELDKRLEKLGY